jgi:hypothetical protein
MDVDMDIAAPAPPPSSQMPHLDQRQRTLHSFWKISSSVPFSVVSVQPTQDHAMEDARVDMLKEDWYSDVQKSHSRKQHNAVTLCRWFSPAPTLDDVFI